MLWFLLNPVKSVEEMPVIAATPPIGTLAKAPIPVTAVAIPAEKRVAPSRAASGEQSRASHPKGVASEGD